jgi:DNA mismatch repair protein MutL
MSSLIELLSDETINQIAAGEVVEGPASVVKELVENALDAEATSICVQIIGGGLQTIVVADDGRGMSQEDATRCILRHATSKIRKAQDLFHISSMGFRGEALASIASISKVIIETSQGESGVRLEIERGEILNMHLCARNKGTSITVRQLFYNVPARRKFQKSPPALSAEVLRTMTTLALGNPSVHFELVSNRRKAIQTRKGETIKERVVSVLGAHFSDGALPLSYDKGSLHFRGLIGSPTMSRPNRMTQYLFLNGRAVLCDAIADEVRKSFGTRLEGRRYPPFLLYLDVPTELIDINVHPQKLYVRFRKEELFRQAICEAVEQALAAPVISSAPFKTSSFQPSSISFEQPPILFAEDPFEEGPTLAIESDPVTVLEIHDRYILFREDNKLSVVDAQAASFRILFEEIAQSIDHKVSGQKLLIPLTIDLTSVESAMVLTHQAAIENLGFSLKPIGKDVFMVEALPPFIDEAEVGSILIEIAAAMQKLIGKVDYKKERKEALCFIIASKGKSKKVRSIEEGATLLERLSSCANSTHCPKGENVRIPLDVETLERLFRTHYTSSRSAN